MEYIVFVPVRCSCTSRTVSSHSFSWCHHITYRYGPTDARLQAGRLHNVGKSPSKVTSVHSKSSTGWSGGPILLLLLLIRLFRRRRVSFGGTALRTDTVGISWRTRTGHTTSLQACFFPRPLHERDAASVRNETFWMMVFKNGRYQIRLVEIVGVYIIHFVRGIFSSHGKLVATWYFSKQSTVLFHSENAAIK